MSSRPRCAVPFRSEMARAASARAASVFRSRCADSAFRKMKTRRNLPVLEHEHRFHQTRDAGCRFQVAKIRFDRADRERRVGSVTAKCFRERVCFNRIADRRASSVRFDKSNRVPARFPHLCMRPAPAAPALPDSEAKCRSCARPG